SSDARVSSMTSSFADDLLPGRNATVSFIKASSGKIPGSRGAQPGYGITGSPDKAPVAIREGCRFTSPART
ncbi:hypothetical protein, partial [Klebsiella aerogenes]|uniref:hypothetical protein n=1 Tax=Klebsiella aerogenes TaxID=548 RepID=UPI001D00778A